MSKGKDELKGLEAFEQLDIGELYYIGGRTFVERGLSYYRQFAVTSLAWDARYKQMQAMVSGSRSDPYEVWLWIEDDRLDHECDCPAWETYGSCKHVIAATAAMFLAVQGQSVGGFQMPPDYARELRQGLGYGDVAQDGDAAALPEATKPVTTLVLSEVNSFGNLRFTIKGPVPSEFLRSEGITLPNSYGFHGTREFTMGDADHALEPFLEAAESEGIQVVVLIEGQQHPLEVVAAGARLRVEHDFADGQVRRSLLFYSRSGELLDPYALIERSEFVLMQDGLLYRVATEDERMVGDRGPLVRYSRIDAFNARGYALDFESREDGEQDSVLRIEGAPAEAALLDADATGLSLELGIWENAAKEPEILEFEASVEVEGCKVSLVDFAEKCLAPVVHAYTGSLLGAKRRVRALLDLIRRILADEVALDDLELADYRDAHPELFENEFRIGVQHIIANLLGLLDAFPPERRGLAFDPVQGRWLAYPLAARKLAMLLFSMADVASRKDLLGLVQGKIPIRRGTSGMDQVQRVVAATRALGVDVRFNEQPIHSKPLSISVDTRASGSDIDWFALHPSIKCGERTIKAEEWQQLIRGQLMIKAEDGSLIIPEVEGDAEAGLQVLADMLRDRPEKALSLRSLPGEELQVSRLEMLDWILLRRHGVQLSLPDEAEALFKSLTSFDELSDFVRPASLQADLRPYQAEGCAWIDFLYRHRFGACLADDMGLGKTVQAIGFLAHRFEQVPVTEGASVLIVLPPSLVFNWQDEFRRFAPTLKVADCLRKADWTSAMADAQIILTTYDRVRTDESLLRDYNFDIVVFDEAHNLKNVTAARTKAAAKLNRRFTLCLTGTPVENNASEFYSVLSAAVPGIFGTIKSFKEAFRLNPDRIIGRSRPFILRRTKDKILKELPKKEEHELFLEMSTLQKEIYTRTVSEVKAEVADAYEDRPEQQAGIVALAAILRLRQVCVSPELLGKHMPEPAPKFGYMADKLEELQAEGHAALVFSQFIGGLDQMELAAKERGIQYLRMDGRTPVAERKDIVRAFQSEAGPSFFFISLKTGGVGLNLTRANYVFHLDPWWNPAVENQASDRAHRIGQTRSVFVQRLIMQHSIEARMLELKARKAELFRQLVDQPGGKAASAGLRRADFDYLLNG